MESVGLPEQSGHGSPSRGLRLRGLSLWKTLVKGYGNYLCTYGKGIGFASLIV